MRITQRQVALGMQIMILIGLVGIAIYQIVAGSPPFAIAANILGVLLAAALFVAYLRGWRYAASAIMLLSILLRSYAVAETRSDLLRTVKPTYSSGDTD